jgi:hypothetical protein
MRGDDTHHCVKEKMGVMGIADTDTAGGGQLRSHGWRTEWIIGAVVGMREACAVEGTVVVLSKARRLPLRCARGSLGKKAGGENVVDGWEDGLRVRERAPVGERGWWGWWGWLVGWSAAGWGGPK